MGFISHRSLSEKRAYQEKQVSTVLNQASKETCTKETNWQPQNMMKPKLLVSMSA